MSPFRRLGEKWMGYVGRESAKAAGDPYAKYKLVGWLSVLLIIAYNVPKVESTGLTCAPCMAWAVPFCASVLTTTSTCAVVAAFPPLLCACLVAVGGLTCAAAAGTCAVVCAIV